MRTHGIEELLSDHPVFRDFDAEIRALLVGCGRNEHFRPGQQIFAEGGPADKVFLIRHGDVAVEIATPERAPIIVETLHEGDLLGWSWMVPPYSHMSDARALTEISAISLDAECIRRKCDDNPALGYQMFRHMLPHMALRLRTLRLQVLDLYGPGRGQA